MTRPWNDPRADIARKLREQPELFLAGEIKGKVLATVMLGFDGHRGWAHYLAVAANSRRRSLGRILMQEAERLLAERGCLKLNLMVRPQIWIPADHLWRPLKYHDDLSNMNPTQQTVLITSGARLRAQLHCHVPLPVYFR